MQHEKVIWDAEFNTSVTWYWLLSGTLIMACTIVGVVLIPFWLFFGSVITRKYLASHKCTLTDRNLKVAKGVFVKTEKTVPLDRITDIGLTQGPIMRALDIEALTVETAGQSSVGSLVQLAGIRDGRAFRDRILAQRDAVVGSDEQRSAATAATPAVGGDGSQIQLLTEIRDVLGRIESAMRDKNG